jgi:hypothetical protein
MLRHSKRRFHAPTGDMIGQRVMYDYAATERYEHVYLNRNLYARHCLSSVGAALADFEQCYSIKIAEQRYLFIWSEKNRESSRTQTNMYTDCT